MINCNIAQLAPHVCKNIWSFTQNYKEENAVNVIERGDL